MQVEQPAGAGSPPAASLLVSVHSHADDAEVTAVRSSTPVAEPLPSPAAAAAMGAVAGSIVDVATSEAAGITAAGVPGQEGAAAPADVGATDGVQAATPETPSAPETPMALVEEAAGDQTREPRQSGPSGGNCVTAVLVRLCHDIHATFTTRCSSLLFATSRICSRSNWHNPRPRLNRYCFQVELSSPRCFVVKNLCCTLRSHHVASLDVISLFSSRGSQAPGSSAQPAAPAQAAGEPTDTAARQETANDAAQAGSSGGAALTIDGIPIPEGVDPSFLEALPESIRREVLAEHLGLHPPPPPAAAAPVPEGQGGSGDLNVSPEFLAALPPDVQQEVGNAMRLTLSLVYQLSIDEGNGRRERERITLR